MSFPYLLHDLDDMLIKTLHYTPLKHGHTPMSRPIATYLKYGLVNLDKPVNPSSHEIVSWIKEMLQIKTGHCGTLDPKVSGALTVLLGRSTRLAKEQQGKGKEYICEIEFHNDVVSRKSLEKAIKLLTDHVLQRPPVMCAVKRTLRLRNIYEIELMEVHKRNALFRVSCEAGTYIRTLCTHIGLLTGYGAHMKDLRRSRSGYVHEDACYTMHDLLDAKYILDKSDESMIRRVVLPLESLLISYKRMIVKDSCISAVCHGAQLTIKGILRYDKNIILGDEIVIVSTKGEAVALAHAVVASEEIANMDHGEVTKTKRVIMERKMYPKVWSYFENLMEVKDEPEK